MASFSQLNFSDFKLSSAPGAGGAGQHLSPLQHQLPAASSASCFAGQQPRRAPCSNVPRVSIRHQSSTVSPQPLLPGMSLEGVAAMGSGRRFLQMRLKMSSSSFHIRILQVLLWLFVHLPWLSAEATVTYYTFPFFTREQKALKAGVDNPISCFCVYYL